MFWHQSAPRCQWFVIYRREADGRGSAGDLSFLLPRRVIHWGGGGGAGDIMLSLFPHFVFVYIFY